MKSTTRIKATFTHTEIFELANEFGIEPDIKGSSFGVLTTLTPTKISEIVSKKLSGYQIFSIHFYEDQGVYEVRATNWKHRIVMGDTYTTINIFNKHNINANDVPKRGDKVNLELKNGTSITTTIGRIDPDQEFFVKPPNGFDYDYNIFNDDNQVNDAYNVKAFSWGDGGYEAPTGSGVRLELPSDGEPDPGQQPTTVPRRHIVELSRDGSARILMGNNWDQRPNTNSRVELHLRNNTTIEAIVDRQDDDGDLYVILDCDHNSCPTNNNSTGRRVFGSGRAEPCRDICGISDRSIYGVASVQWDG